MSTCTHPADKTHVLIGPIIVEVWCDCGRSVCNTRYGMQTGPLMRLPEWADKAYLSTVKRHMNKGRFMAQTRTKLYRNLKPGEKITLLDQTTPGKTRTHTLVVSHVQETCRAYFTGKRQWVVHGNYPWWWSNPITVYSTDKVEVV
jgi:hypothetical protein